MGCRSIVIRILTLVCILSLPPAVHAATTIINGISIPKATIYLSCWNYKKGNYPWGSAKADSTGAFSFAAGNYYGPCDPYYTGTNYTCKITAYAPQGDPDHITAYSSEFACDCSTATDITITHEKKNKTLQVALSDGVGTITSGLTVYISLNNGSTEDYSTLSSSSSGIYKFKVASGKYFVSAYCTDSTDCEYNGFPNAYVTLSDSDTTASTTLSFKTNKSALAVSVTNGKSAISGAAVSAYTYTSSYTSGTSNNVHVSGRTNANGEVGFKVPSGAYTVSVGAPRGTSYTSSSKEVTVGEAQVLAVPIVLASKNSAFTVMVKDENGIAISNANVSGWTNDNGTYDYFWWQTSSSGSFTAYGIEGRKYQVSAYYWPSYESGIPTSNTCNYNLEGYQTAKASTSGVSISFTFPICDHTATFKTVDADGVLVDTIASGWAEVKPASQSSSDGYYAGIGTLISNGKGSVKVRANTQYTVQLSIRNSGYAPADTVTFTSGAAGGTSDVGLVLAKIDATISGNFVDTAENLVTVGNTDYFYIYATKSGANLSCSVASGTYTCDVSAGTWCLGYWVDYNSGYASVSPGASSQCYEVKSKDALKRNLVLLKTGKIMVTLKGPEGSPTQNAWVEATATSAANYGAEKDNYYHGQGCVTDSNGTCTINVGASEAGVTYYVNAHTPYTIMKDNNWTHPDEQSVTVTSGGSAEVILSFGKPDGEITLNLIEAAATLSAKHVGAAKGILKATGDDASVLENATVDIFSNSGAYATGVTDSGGTVTLQCTVADKWYAVASHIFGNYLYMSEATEFACPLTGSKDAQAKEVKIKKVTPLPECQSKSFDASVATSLDCTDGFSVSFPDNVLDSYGGNVSVTLAPVITPFKSNLRPATFYGWRVKASKTDTNEEIINLNGYATISCPCDATQLGKVGLTLADTKAVYYDPSQDAYKDVSSTQESSSCKVTMTTNHLTDFVIAGNGNLKGLDGTAEGVDTGSDASGNSGSCGCRQGSGPVNLPTALLSLLPLVPVFFLRRKWSI